MGIETLLTRLESGFVTPVTPATKRGVTEKSAEIQDCTPVTPVTPANAVMGNKPIKWGATDWQEYFNERAGVCEYDGKLSRPDAERQAFNACISHWMNKNPPAHTDINTCPECSGAIHMQANNALAVLTGNGGHIWLHDRCHTLWLERRRQEAIKAFADFGISYFK